MHTVSSWWWSLLVETHSLPSSLLSLQASDQLFKASGLTCFYALKHAETDWNFYLKPYVQNFQKWGLCALRHVIQNSLEAILAFLPGSIAIHRMTGPGGKMVWTVTNGHRPHCCFCMFCMFVCLNVFCRQPYMQSRGATASDHTSLTVIIHPFLFERVIPFTFSRAWRSAIGLPTSMSLSSFGWRRT